MQRFLDLALLFILQAIKDIGVEDVDNCEQDISSSEDDESGMF